MAERSDVKEARVREANHNRLRTEGGPKKYAYGTRGFLASPGPNLGFETPLNLHVGDKVRYRIVKGTVEIIGKTR
ncbi:hypothetical protein HYU19_05710 [Candidatus Woesearchaeota archaeon]|nr:hypothetical protein [Candidatus Woesearchaeota archaeon]